MQINEFIKAALLNEFVFMALKISLIVGSILALINHGDTIFEGTLTLANVCQIILTFLVPYCVSTYSSIKAIQRHIKQYSDIIEKCLMLNNMNIL